MPVPEVVATGERIGPWACLQSYLMVAELTGCQELNVALPELARELEPAAFESLKRRLIAEMARITAALHTARVFHKDLYLCHFYLDLERLEDDPADVRLVLIDLHRLAEHRLWPDRWRWKDLGQLLYSTAGVAGIDDRDILPVLESITAAGSRCAGRDGRPGWSGSRPRLTWSIIAAEPDAACVRIRGIETVDRGNLGPKRLQSGLVGMRIYRIATRSRIVGSFQGERNHAVGLELPSASTPREAEPRPTSLTFAAAWSRPATRSISTRKAGRKARFRRRSVASRLPRLAAAGASRSGTSPSTPRPHSTRLNMTAPSASSTPTHMT